MIRFTWSIMTYDCNKALHIYKNHCDDASYNTLSRWNCCVILAQKKQTQSHTWNLTKTIIVCVRIRLSCEMIKSTSTDKQIDSLCVATTTTVASLPTHKRPWFMQYLWYFSRKTCKSIRRASKRRLKKKQSKKNCKQKLWHCFSFLSAIDVLFKFAELARIATKCWILTRIRINHSPIQAKQHTWICDKTRITVFFSLLLLMTKGCHNANVNYHKLLFFCRSLIRLLFIDNHFGVFQAHMSK